MLGSILIAAMFAGLIGLIFYDIANNVVGKHSAESRRRQRGFQPPAWYEEQRRLRDQRRAVSS
jgi:hypothetical protein